MSECKFCKGEMKTTFLTRYKDKDIITKAFLKECEICSSNYIFFIKTDKSGNKTFSRTFA